MEKVDFVIRTYLLLYNVDLNKILVSYEDYKGNKLVKFNGGGVEKGETFLQTIYREINEEIDIGDSVAIKFLGVPDNLKASKFEPTKIVLPIYYYAFTKATELGIKLDLTSVSAVEAVKWKTIEQAMQELIFDSDKWALNKLKDLV